MTPFKALYRKEPLALFRGDTFLTQVLEVQALTQEWDLLLDTHAEFVEGTIPNEAPSWQGS